MKLNLKALGLAMVAALAMSAVAASAAQAAGPAKFTAAQDNVAITGHQEGTDEDNFFQTRSSRITCANDTYEALLPEESSTLTVTPHYSGCEASGGIGVTVNLNGCDFTFTVGDWTSEGDVTHGEAGIKCPEGTEITIIAASCTVHIPEQTGLTGVKFHNLGGNEVTIESDVKNITYTETDGFLCPFEGNHHGEDGVFKATVLAKGYEFTKESAHPTTNTGDHPKNQYEHNGVPVNIDVR